MPIQVVGGLCFQTKRRGLSRGWSLDKPVGAGSVSKCALLTKGLIVAQGSRCAEVREGGVRGGHKGLLASLAICGCLLLGGLPSCSIAVGHAEHWRM